MGSGVLHRGMEAWVALPEAVGGNMGLAEEAPGAY